eukprot:Clim_evm4s134 gene=Clim_evmTU4s134
MLTDNPLDDTRKALAERREAAYKDLPWTAFFVSWIKSTEDPIHKIFFKDNDMREDAERVCGGHVHIWPTLRGHFFDKIVRDSVGGENGLHDKGYKVATQIVNLGAGLDTRSIRMAEIQTKNGVKAPRYFEVDREVIADYKTMCYDLEGYNHDNCVITGGDYVTGFDDIFRHFENNGLQRDTPTVVIWEGNINYLTTADLHQTIVRLCKFFQNTTLYIAFDCAPPHMTDGRHREFVKEELALVCLLDKWHELGLPPLANYIDVEEEIVNPPRKMFSAEGINGTLTFVSNEPVKQYADPSKYPDVNNDANLYRMISLIYEA